jgi:hypothetical protein
MARLTASPIQLPVGSRVKTKSLKSGFEASDFAIVDLPEPSIPSRVMSFPFAGMYHERERIIFSLFASMGSSCTRHVLRIALGTFHRKAIRIFLEQEVTYVASEIYR